MVHDIMHTMNSDELYTLYILSLYVGSRYCYK